jgi:hypothetical protein
MLERYLASHRAAILKKWVNLILDTYPSHTAGFLKGQNDRFLNPVGYTIATDVESIYDELVQGMYPDRLSQSLDNIVRVRAVQDFPPSKAVGFVLLLKGAVKEELADEMRDPELLRELLDFCCRIDETALLAFDIYMKCRDKIYEIRAKEVNDRSLKLLERLNVLYASLEEARGLQDSAPDEAT